MIIQYTNKNETGKETSLITLFNYRSLSSTHYPTWSRGGHLNFLEFKEGVQLFQETFDVFQFGTFHCKVKSTLPGVFLNMREDTVEFPFHGEENRMFRSYSMQNNK